jgi:ABC-2 type transport system ATP-binding protein
MADAICIEGLSKTYRKGWQRREIKAVCDVSLRVAQGEAFGFVGPNGAGKSSTIRMLMGLSYPTSGTVSLFGVDASKPVSRQRVAYVPESPYLNDYLTPLEILLMGLRLHDVHIANEERHCMEWLERLTLEKAARAPIRSFSKGMTQRVALAQALCIQPRLMVLDEPLSGLDPVGRHDVVDLLAEYKRDGGTLFFTSHVLHDVERLADRFGLIHEGALRSVRSPGELVGAGDACTVRSMGELEIDGLQSESTGRWVSQVSRDGLWEHLDRLRAAGHVVIEIRPVLSLEQAFMQAIGR